MADEILSPCKVTGGSGMTCHGIRSNVRHIGIPLMVLISTISPQTTCYSAPVCEILPKSDRPRQRNNVMPIFKKADRASLDFRGPMMGSL